MNPIRTCIDRHRILPPHVESMAAQKAALWEPGQVLRIAFRDGLRAERLAVMRAANIWMLFANINFRQVLAGNAEIRCGFDQGGGSWSFVGREILSIPGDLPTMNIGWPNDPGRDIHELGHTLGLIHEHQSPAEQIPWNKPAAYNYYMGSQGWTKAEVDEQVFDRYDGTLITNSTWDGKSIMEYPIPPELVTDPSFAVGWNQALSPTDRNFISALYPQKKSSTIVETSPMNFLTILRFSVPALRVISAQLDPKGGSAILVGKLIDAFEAGLDYASRTQASALHSPMPQLAAFAQLPPQPWTVEHLSAWAETQAKGGGASTSPTQ